MFSINNLVFKNIQYPNTIIPQHQTTFITGESGCGKSTLLKILSGVISSDSGEVMYKNKAIADYNPVMLRREVLLCGQSAFLFDGTIRENFDEFYNYRDLPPLTNQKIEEYLKICAAPFPLTTKCTTASGGERQRVFIAICLSFKPKVLLLDEPTSALDDTTAATLLTNLLTFCKSSAITPILVSHSKGLTKTYADNVITIKGEYHE